MAEDIKVIWVGRQAENSEKQKYFCWTGGDHQRRNGLRYRFHILKLSS